MEMGSRIICTDRVVEEAMTSGDGGARGHRIEPRAVTFKGQEEKTGRSKVKV
jgi:hypothetical protein